MKLLVKVTEIKDAENPKIYGFSEQEINSCIGETITVEIDGPYIKGAKHIVEAPLPTRETMRHTRQMATFEVEII